MGNYDGTVFVGLDSGVCAAGLPQDAMIDQQVNANNRYLDSSRSYVSCTFPGGSSAPSDGAPYYKCRPWASVEFTAPVSIPFWISATTAGAEMSIWCYSASSVNSKLLVVASNLETVVASGAEMSLSGDFEDQGSAVIQAGFSSGLNRSEWGGLQLWIQSKVGSSVQTLSPITSDQGVARVATVTETLSYPANMPTTSSYDVNAIQAPDGSMADLIGLDAANKRILTARMIRFGTAPTRIPLSYVQCRSAGVRQTFTGQSIEVEASELGAQLAVRGEVHTKVAAKVQEQYDRRTLIAWGPSGYFPPERVAENGWGGMPVRFRGVQSNAASGIASCLLQTGIEWRRNGGKMYIAMHVAAVYHGNSAGVSVGASGWDFAASFERPNGSDADYSSPEVLASKTISRTLSTRSSSVFFDEGAPPLLITRRWLYGYVTRGTASWPYAHRDGQLYREDTRLLATVVIEVDMAGVSPGSLGMLRVDVDYLTGTLTDFPAATTTPAALGRSLEVVCTGWTIYQAGA